MVFPAQLNSPSHDRLAQASRLAHHLRIVTDFGHREGHRIDHREHVEVEITRKWQCCTAVITLSKSENSAASFS